MKINLDKLEICWRSCAKFEDLLIYYATILALIGFFYIIYEISIR